MKTADAPFEFVTASFLTQIVSDQASTLCQLRDGLQRSSDASVFFHTFRSLERYHYLSKGFSNEFAQWAFAACNLHSLAARLAAIDLREYVSLQDLRADLMQLLSDYCRKHPREARKKGFEPFFFCESVEVSLPSMVQARTLEEFRDGLAILSSQSFFYHFLSSRLRLHLKTSDFSRWFTESLGLKDLARRVGRIDPYTNTLESAKAKMLALVDKEIGR